MTQICRTRVGPSLHINQSDYTANADRGVHERGNMPLKRIPTEPEGGYSETVTSVGPGRLVHVSGTVGFGPDGTTVVPGGTGAEARATFDNIERALRKAGAEMSDVVKINAFVTSLEDYGAYAEARAERFGHAKPASATVQVAGLLVGASIEIDAVAFVPESADDGRSV